MQIVIAHARYHVTCTPYVKFGYISQSNVVMTHEVITVDKVWQHTTLEARFAMWRNIYVSCQVALCHFSTMCRYVNEQA